MGCRPFGSSNGEYRESLSPRTRDLMQRALDALELEGADLITTLVASAFVDGRNADSEQQRADPPKAGPPLMSPIGTSRSQVSSACRVARLPDLPAAKICARSSTKTPKQTQPKGQKFAMMMRNAKRWICPFLKSSISLSLSSPFSLLQSPWPSIAVAIRETGITKHRLS